MRTAVGIGAIASLPLLGAGSAGAQQVSNFELTVANIMRGPEHFGIG